MARKARMDLYSQRPDKSLTLVDQFFAVFVMAAITILKSERPTRLPAAVGPRDRHTAWRRSGVPWPRTVAGGIPAF